ncbi:unnamed protein product [Urochloa decumbens]|uniref:Uncharacterized protein n=1 Tax=Urochloa decumbens TaxID=240449 RepID=A0ABC9ECZ4_9POAL
MVMGKAKPGKAEGARCRRHQRHRQQGAGVCACCLRERLAHLSLSASSSLPSVVRGGEEESDERYCDDEEAGSSCSEASTAYSSEGSSAASSGCGSPEPAFHDEMRRAARVSLLMRHERVVGDADAVVEFLRARREEQRRRTASSFWAKLLHATRGGGKKEDACSLAARGAKAIEERGAAAKWVLF